MKHGCASNNRRSPEYMVWGTMIQRCENARNRKYPLYGGRGIRVCDRWRRSFTAFIDDMGKRPSPNHQLDRIDNNGDYCPENCRWATCRQNLQNTRRNRMLTHNGETLILSEWSRRTGLAVDCISWRLRHGWSVAKALTKKSQRKSL